MKPHQRLVTPFLIMTLLLSSIVSALPVCHMISNASLQSLSSSDRDRADEVTERRTSSPRHCHDSTDHSTSGTSLNHSHNQQKSCCDLNLCASQPCGSQSSAVMAFQLHSLTEHVNFLKDSYQFSLIPFIVMMPLRPPIL